MFRWEADADGIVTLTMDDPDASANTMNERFGRDLEAALTRLETEKDSITGVVLTSAKKTFFAGGNLEDLRNYGSSEAQKVYDQSQAIKAGLRRLETFGKPVVAAINGAALGGGLEIALATHHRVALDAKGSKIGLPEVTLGLLPGGGGVVRTVRLLGIADALMQVLLQGQQRNPKDALAAGLVHEVVDSPEELVSRAKEWIKANPEAVQPWDEKGYKIPGGTPSVPKFAQNLPAFPANLRKQLKNAPMPAPYNIMCAAVEGSQVDIDNAGKIESRYFADLVVGQVSTNMINAFFFDLQSINKGGSRPSGYEQHSAR
jgi:3-hydroxyacyl-CoA dehydrogenase / enoyl-CoA hydratase / 3-hydroxybutyryl-CoA epimerase